MNGASMHDLAARLAHGDEAAFAELYDACADRLLQFVASRLGSRDEAADVIQSAFLRAVKSRRRFRGVDNPIAYMFQIGRRETMRLLKGRRSNVQSAAAGEAKATVQDTNERQEDAEFVKVALARLTTEERELVELKLFGQLTFREIADITGRPAATVATQYRRALESLRPWLAKQLR
jgi:RNA polymerase sigma-70 factor (ECF subfamily)